jgi:hypothetical protein
MLPRQAIELRPIGQSGKGITPLLLRETVEIPLIPKTTPLAEDRQGQYLTLAKRSLWSGFFLQRQFRFAEIIDHDVQCRQKGICVDHRFAPYD